MIIAGCYDAIQDPALPSGTYSGTSEIAITRSLFDVKVPQAPYRINFGCHFICIRGSYVKGTIIGSRKGNTVFENPFLYSWGVGAAANANFSFGQIVNLFPAVAYTTTSSLGTQSVPTGLPDGETTLLNITAPAPTTNVLSVAPSLLSQNCIQRQQAVYAFTTVAVANYHTLMINYYPQDINDPIDRISAITSSVNPSGAVNPGVNLSILTALTMIPL